MDRDRLICAPVGPDATVVALNKRTGELVWKTKVPGDEGESYAATVLSDAGGIRQYVVFLRKGLVGVAAEDGRILWRYEGTVGRFSNSYTPIVQGDFVFSANGYGGGMALLKLLREGDGIVAHEQYHNEFIFSPFEDSTVLVGDHVYAFQGATRLVCIALKTGTLAWGPIATESKGRSGLTYADGRLYIRRASGSMVLVEATPDDYVERGSFQIPEREEASGVTFPVVADGRLYIRDNNRVFCYDLSADAPEKPRTEPRTIVLSVLEPGGTSDETHATQAKSGRDRMPDAVFVATPNDVVAKMLELAAVKKGDLMYDLGSGDGRIVMAAARRFGSKAVGYEIDLRLVEESRRNIKSENLGRRARIEHADLFSADLSNADAVAVYLPSHLLRRLLPQLKKMKPGARIVSHQFPIPGIKPDESATVQSSEDGDQHKIFLWVTPLKQ